MHHPMIAFPSTKLFLLFEFTADGTRWESTNSTQRITIDLFRWATTRDSSKPSIGLQTGAHLGIWRHHRILAILFKGISLSTPTNLDSSKANKNWRFLSLNSRYEPCSPFQSYHTYQKDTKPNGSFWELLPRKIHDRRSFNNIALRHSHNSNNPTKSNSQHHSKQLTQPTQTSTVIKMAITTTNDTKRSRNRKRADRTSAALRLGLISTYYCLALTSVYQSSQIQTCAAFSPLFTASTKPSTNIASVSKTLSSASARTILSMAPKGKKEKKGKKKKEEDHRRWMSWLSSGTTSRHADEVRMREAEELGGVARSDRYSAG